MTLYQVIHDFFATYVFTPADFPACSWQIGGVSVSLAEWLNVTATIVTLTALVLAAFMFVRWLVKLVGNGLMRIGG